MTTLAGSTLDISLTGKYIHFKSQVFSFPNTPLPSNADIFDLCAPSLNHLPLCRLLCRSLKASPHSNLVYSGSETEHKVAKRVDKSWWLNDWFNYISFYLTTLYDDITMITSMTRTRAASVTILILMSCLLCWVPVSVSHLLICQKVSLFMMDLMMISYLIMIMIMMTTATTMMMVSRAASSATVTWTQCSVFFCTHSPTRWSFSSPSSTPLSLLFDTIRW